MSSAVIDAIIKAQEAVQKFFKLEGDNWGMMPIFPDHPHEGEWLPSDKGLPVRICRELGVDLEIAHVPMISPTVNAYILRYENPDRARIAYSQDINRCWSRFFVCKEFSHILLANNGNLTSSIKEAESIIKKLVSGAPAADGQDDKAHLAEIAAYYAAMELLLPQQYQADVEDMKRNHFTYDDIARSYRIPLAILECRYDPDIEALFDEAYRQIRLRAA